MEHMTSAELNAELRGFLWDYHNAGDAASKTEAFARMMVVLAVIARKGNITAP